MRLHVGTLVAGLLLGGAALAGERRHFEDAALHAVQFIDRKEGWAVGDEGVIWHSIDGGRTWERQPSGVRASLRSLHFLDPYTGWVVGREELPHGGGSAGVVLLTRDGGIEWQRVATNVMPGLNWVHFFNERQGILLGDGSDAFPTGIYTTADGGRTWQATPGPRCTSWLSAGFAEPQSAVLAGAWSRLATLRQGVLNAADVDTLGGRTVHGLCLEGDRAVAVGQGGLVLLSHSAGQRWGYADLKLPAAVRASLDFHAVQCRGERTWLAGRPGSVVFYSPDRGQSWQIQRTGQPLPLYGLFFLDSQTGWAVGELGTILGTRDGGQTWTVQRRGGRRAAALFVHARPESIPLETLAILGHEEGCLTTSVCVTSADPASAALRRAVADQTLALAVRQVGGAAGEALWQFPLPQHLAHAGKAELLAAWDRRHGDRSAEQLLRQCVLALRMWQPEVVITDYPDSSAGARGCDALVAEAVHEAFRRAADAGEFAEQIEVLGLAPCSVKKLYCVWPERARSQVVLDVNEPSSRLGGTARDLASDSAALLAEPGAALPRQRFYRLAADRLDGAAGHRTLLQGLELPAEARRTLAVAPPPAPDLDRALRDWRNLQSLAEAPANELADPDRLLAQVGPLLDRLPDEQAARAAWAIAHRYVQLGQWPLAREAFLLLVDRYPVHPLSAEAYRWLIQHNSSSEARRRQELGQFLVVQTSQVRPAPAASADDNGPQRTEAVHHRRLAILGSMLEVRRWYEGCFAIEERLSAFGPLYGRDPAIGFCLQSANRNLGKFDAAREWYTRFKTEQASGPWREAAAAELWLSHRAGPPPKPVLYCRQTALRPLLDGCLDDDCWRGAKPLILAGHKPDDELATEVRMAYDRDFLYLALCCRCPPGSRLEPVKGRKRDADLRPFDRVSLLLDLDRDYSSYFHFQVDQRGCVCEDCWGDASWNPRWFVAAQSDETCWRIEAAIPLLELTSDPITIGRAWAANVVRIVPGRGVQAFSQPADAQPRPEGMGLLLFAPDPDQARTGPLAN
jgi:photosystem II stability/assembly factor-like uncharacterized protein